MDRVEAIKILKSRHDISLPFERDALETLIPELKESEESEEERVRKDIIGLIKFALNDGSAVSPGSHTTKEEAISWLEKQKEQKPADEQFPPLEELDAIKAKYYDKGFKNGFDEGAASVKSAEWSEKHIADIFEKVGLAKIAREQGNEELTNALQDAMLELSKMGNTELSEEDETYLQDALWCVEKAERSCKNEEDKGACWSAKRWLKSLPERKTLQSKQEWSEEDELKMNALLKYLDPDAGGTKYSSYAQLTEWYNWLKSLRPSWRPEGQQLDCLRHMINVSTVDKDDKQLVRDLYRQLKKL